MSNRSVIYLLVADNREAGLALFDSINKSTENRMNTLAIDIVVEIMVFL